MGVGIAVIKCGVKGMYYKTGNADAMARLREKSGRKLEGFENQEGLEKSYVPARVRSATGAGDTSIGAFLCAVLRTGLFCNACTWQQEPALPVWKNTMH